MGNEQLEHLVVSNIKLLAQELGRTPSRTEYNARYANVGLRAFGGLWSVMVQAAGLEQHVKPKKIDNSIFKVSIERHLETVQPTIFLEDPDWPNLAVISDIHWPFHQQRVIDKFYRYCESEKPDWVILNGDARDYYSYTRFPRSHNIFTPREENDLGRKLNQEFWDQIKKICPKAKLKQMLGNHCLRPLKQAMEHYPASEDWISQAMKTEFGFEGVDTVMDPREEFILLPNLAIFHGYLSQLGAHRDYTLMNCINSHTHRGGVALRRIRGQTLWELNSGYAGNPEAKGLTYTPQKITNWTPGFGGLNYWGPRFISA